ncbi:MAG: F0F1 ATP synthase subunit A [Bacteroidaceae bacterium]|nr:F0F1 ATP synthase subunit A [Bacteroidaceae bacterium]
MRLMRYIMLMLMLLPCGGAMAADVSQSDGEAKAVDVKKIIFDHVKDSYEWHITTFGKKHITLSLPIIIYSSRTGWELFSSSVFHYADEYKGYRISKSGNYEGKIVELDADGNERRPVLDLSLTKTVVSVFIISFLLVMIVIGTARWYKQRKPTDEAPRGFVGVMEMVINMVVEGVIKPNVGSTYKKYVPFLLTVFFMIFLTNLMGLLPIFPGGANVTGNISIALALALCTFVAVNVFGNKEYYKEIFWPDVPAWLKLPVPLMPVIELVGVVVKPFALTIRLFANILAGHTALLAFVSIIFVTMAVNRYIGSAMTVVSVFFTIFMNVLELLVAFIQAFVFTMLSSVFIGLSQPEHRKEKH